MFILSAFDARPNRPFFHASALLAAFSLRRHTDAPIRLVSSSGRLAGAIGALSWCPFTTIDLAEGEGKLHPKLQKMQAIRTGSVAQIA